MHERFDFDHLLELSVASIVDVRKKMDRRHMSLGQLVIVFVAEPLAS